MSDPNQVAATATSVDLSMSPTVGKIAEALAKAQAALGHASKDSVNPHLKNRYASLSSCMEACRPLLEHGIAVVQPPAVSHLDGVCIDTLLLHASGEWIRGRLYLPASKKDPQGFGAALTYARRYCLCSTVGLVADEDDDAEATTARRFDKPQDRPAQPPPARTPPRGGSATAPQAPPPAKPPGSMPASGAELFRRLEAHEQKLAVAGKCQPTALVEYVRSACKAAGFGEDFSTYNGLAITCAVGAARDFEQRLAAPAAPAPKALDPEAPITADEARALRELYRAKRVTPDQEFEDLRDVCGYSAWEELPNKLAKIVRVMVDGNRDRRELLNWLRVEQLRDLSPEAIGKAIESLRRAVAEKAAGAK